MTAVTALHAETRARPKKCRQTRVDITQRLLRSP